MKNPFCLPVRAVLFAGMGLCLALARAVAGDEHWDPAFGVAGTTNNGINGIVMHNGMLYAGGYSPTTTNTSLQVWNGTNWSVLGNFTGGLSEVFDLAFVGNTLYVAGYFTNVSGVAANGLAEWNGTSWSGVGFNGVAEKLAVDGSKLYVGGIFTTVGALAATNIAWWDGAIWHAMGSGLGQQYPDSVFALAATNGTLYAGGAFTNSGTLGVTNLAFWNGSSWSVVGGGVNGSQIQSLVLNGTSLYASGTFTQAGSVSVSDVARWDGANWSGLGGGLNGGASLAVFSNLLCAAGSFTMAGGIPTTNFAIWNGSSWSDTPGGLNAAAGCAYSSGSDVIVGGRFTVAGGLLVYGIARCNGVNWTAIGSTGRTNGANSTVRALASDGTNLYAGGNFAFIGENAASLVARWNGTSWSPLGSGVSTNNNGVVFSAAIVGTNVYFGGSFTSAGGVPANNIARWDGANWHALSNGIPAAVTALAASGTNLFACGNFGMQAADAYTFCVARWDGVNWWSVTGPMFSSTILIPIGGVGMDAVAVQGSNVYLGGNFKTSNSSNQASTNIVRWDGTDWQTLDGGVTTNDVRAVAIIGSNVYVGGKFTNAGTLPAQCIAKWDGQHWSNLAGGVVGSGYVSALASVNSNLYAGGSFTNMGGVPVNFIAKWDGTNWSAPGSGVVYSAHASSSGAFALDGVGSDLYAGGFFSMAGTNSSSFIGHWNETVNFNQVPGLLLGNLAGIPGGPFSFIVTATAVPAYVIEATTNFSTWTPLLTNTNSPYHFSDPAAAGLARRFYRARSAP